MAIEMTSNGRTKTYCYYPTDVLYANGKQIKEVWVDGVKYYPKIYNENTCVIRFFGCSSVFREPHRKSRLLWRLSMLLTLTLSNTIWRKMSFRIL